MRSDYRTDHSKKCGKQRQLCFNVTALRIPGCRDHSSHGGTQFIGPNGQMRRYPCCQIRRKGYKASASCYGIYKTRQKNKRAYDQKWVHRLFPFLDIREPDFLFIVYECFALSFKPQDIITYNEIACKRLTCTKFEGLFRI